MSKFYPGEREKLVKVVEKVVFDNPGIKASDKLLSNYEKSVVKEVLEKKKK